MCGICGILDPNGLTGKTALNIEKMKSVLAHRGPDGAGTYLDPDGLIALGHARLKIIDLSERATQPMSNETGEIWVAYNGEIYNFLALRRYLEQQAHQFKSESDTEVLVHLYEEKGERMLEDMNGMFAFALWDRKRRRLLLARDRLGVKPLVYTQLGDKLLFASELKALLQHQEVPREIDLQALLLYLTFNYIPAPYTIFKGIYKLEPAHYLLAKIASDGKLELESKRYWDLQSSLKAAPVSHEEALVGLRELLEDAVRSRLIADVPLGAFLSGGVDSSLIVALMARHQAKVKTFTIGYEDIPLYDERKYARIIAEKYDTDHQEIIITSKQVQGLLQKVLDSLDEPFGDSSLIPYSVVSCVTRKHVTVALSGDGGDEVFGGYTKYKGEAWAQLLARMPGKSSLKAAANLLPTARGNYTLNRLRMAKRFIRGLDEDLPRRHFNWMNLFDKSQLEQLLNREVFATLNDESSGCDQGLQLVRDLFSQTTWSNDLTNRALYTDVNFVLPYDMLMKADAASMLNSLEIRSPFVDYRLVEYGFRIPGNLKVGLLDGKKILKEAFAEELPRSIQRRPKGGFGIPIGEWFRTDLKPLLEEVLSRERLQRRGLFNPEIVHKMMELHFQRRRDYFWELWNLLVFEVWAGNYLD